MYVHQLHKVTSVWVVVCLLLFSSKLHKVRSVLGYCVVTTVVHC